MSSESEQRLTGMVKWFNNKSGFGFVTVCSEGEFKGKDIFAHYSSIRVTNSQYKYLVQGEYVEFTLVSSERSGIVRFARRKFVQPGMLELKQVELHGEKLKVKPYNPDANGNSPPTEHTYDKDTADEAFDRW